MPEMKGITVKIPAELHAEVKAYLEAHGMTMGEFIAQAVDHELHPKIQITQEDKNMERMRTLAFQVPDSLFQRVKAYLERNHMTQKQFVIGLIESEIEQDEAQYQASHPEEQEDEEESDDQTEDEETEQETHEEAQDEFVPPGGPGKPRIPTGGTTRSPGGLRPHDDFEAGSQEVSQEDDGTEETDEETQETEEVFEDGEEIAELDGIEYVEDSEREDSLEDEEAWEETTNQEDSQDEGEQEDYSYSMSM